MKILFFTTGLGKGGTETQLYNLLKELKKDKKYQIKLISMVGGSQEDAFRKLNILVEVSSAKTPFGHILFYMSQVKQFRPNIVHTCLFHANIISKFSCFLQKKKYKLICSYRGLIKTYPIINFLEKWNKNKPDLLLANSQQALDQLTFYKRKPKTQVINNGFVPKAVTKTNIAAIQKQYGQNIVLTVARLHQDKDFDTNIAVAKAIHKKHPDAVFLYAGDGPLQTEIQSKTKTLPFIKVLGRREDVADLYNAAKVFFMPTLSESQSNSLIEAMFYKVPIVTTDIPENRIVPHAAFCKKRNQQQMIQAIDTLLKKQNKVHSSNNYKHAKEIFSLQAMIQAYKKTYEDLYVRN
ncbi:MAG: glycosyltransferase involved in cell wall biosynthesis [Candidatus Woesearchaeota archaeon]|jgi:glycosyltransferase involved in cell wall biosynthesis